AVLPKSVFSSIPSRTRIIGGSCATTAARCGSFRRILLAVYENHHYLRAIVENFALRDNQVGEIFDDRTQVVMVYVAGKKYTPEAAAPGGRGGAASGVYFLPSTKTITTCVRSSKISTIARK